MSEFRLGDELCEFNSAQDAYRDLREIYQGRADKSFKDFLSRYDVTFSNAATVASNLERFSSDELSWALDAAVCDLIARGVYDVDDDLLAKEYVSTEMTWNEDVEPFVAAHNRIVANCFDRTVNQSGNVPVVVGGGFGFEGAAQGLVMAAGANAIIGGLSRIMDTAAAGALQREANSAVTALVQSEEVRYLLADAINRLVLNLHRTVCNQLIKNRGVNIQVISREEERRASAIVNNVVHSRIDPDKERACLVEALRLNPFDHVIYDAWEKREHPTDDEFARMRAAFVPHPSETPQSQSGPSGRSVSEGVLKTGIMQILSSYSSDDYFVSPNIPERKIQGAIRKYFNSSITPFLGQSNKPDDILCLIDSTSFGSAEFGLAISVNGICWNDQDGPESISWKDYIDERPEINKGLLGVYFGEKEFSLAGSKVKKDFLINLIEDVAGYMKARL